MMKFKRRKVLKLLGVGAAAGALGGVVWAQTPSPIKVADLEALKAEYTAVPFVFGGVKSLLVRLPPGPGGGRVLEARSGNPPLRLTAYTRVCTHLGCTPGMLGDDHRMVCPCHGSVYAADGSVIHGPAERPLQAIQLEVREAAVYALSLIVDK